MPSPCNSAPSLAKGPRRHCCRVNGASQLEQLGI
jgi:hypothetical protein